MKLISIVAAAENNVIGIDNKMPWHLPDDLKFFKKTTMGAPIIMGKNTWFSIGAKALPKRLNIIISSSIDAIEDENVKIFSNLDDCISYLEKESIEKAFIIGGGQLYKATMDIIDEMYITRVHSNIENGMVYFPSFSSNDWEKVWEEYHAKDEKHSFDFTFEHWLKTK